MAFTWSFKMGNAEGTAAVSKGGDSANTSESERQKDRAIAFVKDMGGYSRAYHNHKEQLAIAGITFQVSIFGAALISKEWPPDFLYNPWSSMALTTFAWLLILFYLKWQLRKRRWASLRIAATERLLAKWITVPPTTEDLKTLPQQAGLKIPLSLLLLDYIIPVRSITSAVDVSESVYPAALVISLKEQEGKKMGAIEQERFIVLVGWFLWLALLIRTWFWPDISHVDALKSLCSLCSKCLGT